MFSPFTTTTVGSFPRTDEVRRAQRDLAAGRTDCETFEKVADEAVRQIVKLQEEVGLDVVTDGEQRRENFYSFVSDKLEGVQLMSLAEMLDIVEDKVGFEKLLQSLDVPAYSIFNPTCVGHLKRKQPLAADEARFLKTITDRPVKIPLPGPYLLTRAMWVPEATGKVYDSKEHLSEDVVRVLREEIEALIAEGVEVIQFDEPVLTELVFTQGNTRTFMCAALAARKDPAEELEFAAGLMQDLCSGFKGRVMLAMHVCRGNWSRDESTLLKGSYAPLKETFAKMPLDQLVLEYATPRAGEIMAFEDKSLGLGVVNPRTDALETADEIVERVRELLEFLPGERIWLNPDCGFGTFSARPMNDWQAIRVKLTAMVEASRRLRE